MKKMLTRDWHQARGAEFEDYFGYEVPSHYGNVEEEYWALRKSVALRDVSFFGKVKISGKDSQQFLHRMVSNDVKSLTPGHGVWALFLDIKGHIQGDFKLYAFPDHLLMVLQHYVQERVLKGLDRYIISEQVTKTDLSQELAMFQLFGPEAESFLKSKGVDVPAETLSFHPSQLSGVGIHVIRLGTGIALLCTTADAVTLLDRLEVRPVGMRAFEIFRVEMGLPLLQRDVEETNFPQECRMDAALNFNKGCYLGQEVMARIDAQGHVNRFLMGLLSPVELSPGQKLYRDEKEIGKITTAALSPYYRQPVAMGYVRREFAKEGEKLEAGDDRTTVIVKEFPMVQIG